MPAPAISFALSVTLGENSFSASGKHDLVLKAFEDFKAMTGHATTPEAGSSKPAAGSRVTRAKGAGTARPAGGMSLPAFLEPLKLKSGPKTGAAIVAWGAEHGGKDKMSSAEVRDHWKQTKYKLPSSLGNVTRDLKAAAQRGLLRTEGKDDTLVFYATPYEQEQIAKLAAG